MSTTPRHRVVYAQNVLRSPRLVDRLLTRSTITADDLVVEIGPGRGIVTERLAARCRQVLAIEKDPALVETLRARFADAGNVAVFAADFLDFPLPVTGYKVFASIPFNVTAAIVGKLTSGSSPPADTYLVVQREAAARFRGSPRATLVAVMLWPWFAPSVVHRFRPTDFVPAPAVDTVLLRLQRREHPLVAAADAAPFADLAAHVFTAWRATVGDALAVVAPKRAVAAIERVAGVDLACPPSALPVAAWPALFAAYRTVMGNKTAGVGGARERLVRQQAGLQKRHRTRSARGAPRSVWRGHD